MKIPTLNDVIADAMKKGMRQWASGVSVISTRDDQGQPQAMTVSSLTSVSDNPASLLVCINETTRMASILKKGQIFCANLLTQEHETLSNLCASPGKQDERFEEGRWHLAATPRLADASAVFECEVDSVVPYGTHFVVIGKINQVYLNDVDASPLCYWNGGYQSLNLPK